MCVSGNDIWHLDCDRAEAAGIRAGTGPLAVLLLCGGGLVSQKEWSL